MENRVVLKFDKILTGLAGYDFGKDTYNEQVLGKVNYAETITIVFPANIQRVASSFIQGFFEELVKKIGISGIEERVEIESSKSNMKNMIIDNLL